MNNKLIKDYLIKIIFACLAIAMSCFYFFNAQDAHNTKTDVQPTVSTLLEETAPSPIIESNNKVITVKKLEPVIANTVVNEEFRGISRLSNTAKDILSDAGVMPADIDVNSKDVVYLEFDLDSLRKLEVGETFDLEIPQTQEIFTAEITQVDQFDNGDKSLISNVIGQGGDFHTSIITVGKDAMYGQFTTVSGNWVFESKNEYGWIAAKRDLYKNHVEFEPSKTSSEETGEDYTISPNNQE
jgi:hypothetical protein